LMGGGGRALAKPSPPRAEPRAPEPTLVFDKFDKEETESSLNTTQALPGLLAAQAPAYGQAPAEATMARRIPQAFPTMPTARGPAATMVEQKSLDMRRLVIIALVLGVVVLIGLVVLFLAL